MGWKITILCLIIKLESKVIMRRDNLELSWIFVECSLNNKRKIVAKSSVLNSMQIKMLSMVVFCNPSFLLFSKRKMRKKMIKWKRKNNKMSKNSLKTLSKFLMTKYGNFSIQVLNSTLPTQKWIKLYWFRTSF